MNEKLANFLRALEEDRIKRNTDYALVRKYDQNRILCHEVYRERIEAVAREHGVEILEWFTYS